ncbi:hypothetical protein MJ581_04570 [Escherichia coli]|nr:hypothetical protein MJ581_04570 [Escherichia coli]
MSANRLGNTCAGRSVNA